MVARGVAVREQTIGDRLRYLREARGLTLEQAASQVGIARTTLHGYESGRRRPDPEILRRLARLYGSSVAYLYGETDNPFTAQQDKETPSVEQAEQQLEYFLRGTGRLTERDIKVILRLFEELARGDGAPP